MDKGAVLSGMEAVIAVEDVRKLKPIPVDRWISSSALQKSIRRGDTLAAQRSALTFWLADRRGFWRRIGVICTEDIGVASVDTIVKVLAAINTPAWRAQQDDLKTALYMTRILCEATKIRLSDEIISVCANAVEYGPYRVALAKADNQTLADIALHDKTPLAERAISLWFLAGTARYRHDNLPHRAGSLDAAADVMRLLGAPADLTENCIAMLNRSQHPLALLTPLLWTEVQHQPWPLLTWFDKFELSPVVKGVPLVALDMFTRSGKICFAQLQKTVPDLKPFSTKQIAIGVFFAEGCCIDKRLGSERLDEYRQAGEFADAEGVGMDAAHYIGLREILAVHADTLQTIRRRQLRAYLDRPQGDLFEGGAE